MSQNDIDETTEAFAAAAVNAKSIGFAGVELHAGHGYLIDQFLWGRCNNRSDYYNGGLRDRTRFCTEIISEIRTRVGREFCIGVRFSQWKLPSLYEERPYQNPKLLAELLEPLVDVGVDYFHCSTRRYWEPAFSCSKLTLAGWTKKLSGKTTIAVGSVGLAIPIDENLRQSGNIAAVTPHLENLEESLANGEFDLIALGRALIANPDWPLRVRRGETDILQPFDPEMLKTHLQ